MEGKAQAVEDRTQSGKRAADKIPEVKAPTADTRKHKRLGLVLSQRYRIESLIASGGMSDVYKAVDLHLEQAGTKDCFVALKILRSELTQDANALNLLAREAAKSKRLSHPNIIRVHDLGHDGDTWFMVMELLDGEPLSRIIQRVKPNGLKWKGGKGVLEQVASALAASHRKDIVHADLKPSNIFFTRNGEIKLLDFGVAQALKPHQHVDFLNPRNDDETTVYGYTPAYATPELIEGKEPTVHDDLYALACISFELLSSRHPFDRKKLTTEEKAGYKVNKPRNMPGKLWRVVRKLLKNDAEGVNLPAFQTAIQPTAWSQYVYPVGIAASLLTAATLWYQGAEKTAVSEAKLAVYQDRADRINTLDDLPPDQLITALDTLEPLERAGLLKLQQDRILRYYEDRIDDDLQAPGRPNLPNVPAALTTLNDALALYPRDQQLNQRFDRLNQRKLSLEAALSNELIGRLEQGNYQDQASFSELESLAEDYLFLSGTPLALPPGASDVFQQQLSHALANDDNIALGRLLGMSKMFSIETPEIADRLSEARHLESAIKILGEYHSAIANGEQAVFPVSAAEQLYSGRLSQWQETIATATNSKALDNVYDDLSRYREQIPAHYKPFDRIRQALADAYLAQADSLLKQNRTTQAQPLLKRATALMRNGSNS